MNRDASFGPADTGLSDAIAGELPYFRRYARALTGNQASGDHYAVMALEALIADPLVIAGLDNAKIALFRVFHNVWLGSGACVGSADTRLSIAAQTHLAKLTPNSREALLLHSIEGFSHADIAAILDITASEATVLITQAVAEMKSSVTGRVMVIEDETIIAMDITAIIDAMGHAVTGVARTHQEALVLARKHQPDLILADIQLADKSSGINAVHDILQQFADIPVIFITAFPERLLTGTRPEPAFLINKPYTEEQVRSAVSQALFFASTETLVR